MSRSDGEIAGSWQSMRNWWTLQAWSLRGDSVFVGGALTALFLLVLFLCFDITDPESFRRGFLLEDGPKERAEILLLFIALGQSAAIVVLLGRRLTLDGEPRFSYLVLFILVFVLLMEETDWLQIYFQYEVPKFILKYNDAGECNIHNMDFWLTGYLEALYYLVVIGFVVLRGWQSLRGSRRKWPFEVVFFLFITVLSRELHDILKNTVELTRHVHYTLHIDNTPYQFFIRFGLTITLVSRLMVLLRFRYSRGRFRAGAEPYQISSRSRLRA